MMSHFNILSLMEHFNNLENQFSIAGGNTKKEKQTSCDNANRIRAAMH